MALIPLNEGYLPMILQWRNAPAVREKMYTNHIISWEEHQAWFEKVQCNHAEKWFVYHEKNATPAGVVGLTSISDKNHSAFWGFYTAEKSMPGVGSRMGLEALDYVFQECKLHKLNGEVLANNGKSIRYHEKLGFSREGFFRDAYFDGNSYVDVVRMAILEDEWSDRRNDILTGLPTI